MPIYKGERLIAKIYRGDREITSVYKGDNKVFKNGERVVLFYDGDKPIYKAIYTKNNTTASVSIPFSATPNFDPTTRKYEIVYKDMPSAGSSLLFRQNSMFTRFARTRIALGKQANEVSLPTAGKNKVVIDKEKLYVDDDYIQDLTIGNELDNDVEQRLNLGIGLSFYEMKIYQNDVLVYHFVPAYFISNGEEVYGIAELISQETYFNAYLTGKPEYQ